MAAITYNQPTTQSAWHSCKCLGGAIGGALGLWASGHDAGSQVLLDKAAAVGIFAEVCLRGHNKTAIREMTYVWAGKQMRQSIGKVRWLKW